MSLPLSVILKELESAPTSSIVPILSSLHHNKAILATISKQDRRHLVSRSLNLTRAVAPYSKWCGVNLIFVLSGDYTVLAEDGVHFIAQLLKIIEQSNTSSSLLTSAVECLNRVCQQIRGKPTLTREILTPKLPAIITLFMEKISLVPALFVDSLTSLIKNHPTTFRPFGNKLRAKLITFIVSPEFDAFPRDLKEKIYRSLATLPAIEKTEPELKWQQDVTALISETTQVMLIYREFLNLNDDEELISMLGKIPTHSLDPSAQIFADSLSIDVNVPKTLFNICDRVDILVSLLATFLNTDTAFAVRVPIGMVVTLVDIISSINTRFISFKNDVHDPELKRMIQLTLQLNQLSATKLLARLPNTYSGSLLPHLSNVLSLMEVLLPFANKKIDTDAVWNNEPFMRQILECVTQWLELTSSLSDATQLLRFIDVALKLVEPRSTQSSTTNGTTNVATGGVSTKKKNNKKKNNGSAPLSDLLSHQHLFKSTVSVETSQIVRRFINSILKKANVPPTQHYKIVRYIIVEATRAKKLSLEGSIPVDLKQLLIDAVLYPGTESVSLLPIVTSLLGDDPILSVFNNPRFPPLARFVKNVAAIDEEEEDDEEEEEDVVAPEQTSEFTTSKRTSEEEEEESPKRQRVDPAASIDLSSTEDSKIVFATTVTESAPISLEPVSTEPVVSTFEATVVTSVAAPEEDDNSDFEMPSIDVDGDDVDSD
ncbi:pre-rRNA-processing protein Rix1p [[Candida] anglica]|uniref:Pre-rRNA-processing protein RIX1 n=1 Tax=[Candida] anglica TaxID=148631 RepID=A0ABP0EM69_9ASCO